MRYAVIIEWAETNYSAYVPDLPGCVSVGDTLEEVTRISARRSRDIWRSAGGRRSDPAPRTRAIEVEVVLDAA